MARNVYIIIQNGTNNDNLTAALAKGKRGDLPHNNIHYATQGTRTILQGDFTDEEIAWFDAQPWAAILGNYQNGRAEGKVYTNGFNFLKPTVTPVTASPHLLYKSIDTMKLSRDSSAAQTPRAKMETHIGSLVQHIPGLTHIAIGCYQNNFGYHPLSWIKEWFTVIHARGKKVLFRPALGNAGWTNAAELTTLCVNTVTLLSDVWENGDLCDIIPESNPTGGPYNAYYGLGNPASWNRFVRDTTAPLKTAFTNMGKDVKALWSQTDQTFIFNSRVEAATLTAMGNLLCIDFYPMDAGTDQEAVDNFVNQLGSAKTRYPSANIFVTETGYNNQSLVSEEQQRSRLSLLFSRLSAIPYVIGFNYWVSYGNDAFDKTHLYKSLSLDQPKSAVTDLQKFYGG